MQCFIFLDTEGTPIQELAALAVDVKTHEVIGSYHKFAKTDFVTDSSARTHVHGLNPFYLSRYGLSSEALLIKDFKCWLNSKNYKAIFANAPQKEQEALSLEIISFDLPKWVDRRNLPSHKMANSFKDRCVALGGNHCSQAAHHYYKSPPFSRSSSYPAKLEHGFHCAFYDAVELYFYYLS